MRDPVALRDTLLKAEGIEGGRVYVHHEGVNAMLQVNEPAQLEQQLQQWSAQ